MGTTILQTQYYEKLEANVNEGKLALEWSRDENHTRYLCVERGRGYVMCVCMCARARGTRDPAPSSKDADKTDHRNLDATVGQRPRPLV